MAKKKRRITEEPAEEYEFTPTEFNEREFILKDIYSAKIFAVFMIAAVIVGIVTALLINACPLLNDDGWVLMSLVATLISFGVMACLKKICSLLGLHPELMDAKSLLGPYFTYLILALTICIIGVQFGNF